MVARRRLDLNATQRAELTTVRDHHPKPYLRERAAALLKVASGQAVRHVAEEGLLRRHEPETVSDWMTRYQQQGIAGLHIRAGRGRKAAFSPSQRRGRPGGAADLA